MTKKSAFTPRHINATPDDLAGNNGVGRYILLPGSDGRAKQIAEHFDNLTSKPHPRSHNLFLGSLNHHGTKIDVATVSSGIGCPSMEIILHELFHLGGKRFLRVGTAGSLQPNLIKLGDIINVAASVRDEGTTNDYMPLSIPAVASLDMLTAVNSAAQHLQLYHKLHSGTVHCKASFYAREFGAGPRKAENDHFLDLLSECGVLASEMETATLFIQSQLYNHTLMQQSAGPAFRVIYGALLGIVAIPPHEFASKQDEATTIENMTTLALQSIKTLWEQDQRLLAHVA